MSQLRLCKTLICLISVKYLCRTDTDSANLPLVISQGESLPLVNFEHSSLNQSTAQSGRLYLMFLKQLQDLADSRACAFSISRQCLILFQTLNLKIKKKVRKQHLAQKQDGHLFSDRVKKLLGDPESIYSQKACERCNRMTVLQQEKGLVASPHDRVWQAKSVIIMFKKLL